MVYFSTQRKWKITEKTLPNHNIWSRISWFPPILRYPHLFFVLYLTVSLLCILEYSIAIESRQNLVALVRITKRRISMLSVQRRKFAHSFYWIVKVNLFQSSGQFQFSYVFQGFMRTSPIELPPVSHLCDTTSIHWKDQLMQLLIGNLYTLLLNLQPKFWQIFQITKASISRIRFCINSFMVYIIYVEVLGTKYL